MISLVNKLPDIKTDSILFLKIKIAFSGFKSDAMHLYVQDDNKALILHDGENVTILNNGANLEELKEFLNFFGAKTILTDKKTLSDLGYTFKELFVMKSLGGDGAENDSDNANSEEIYKALKQKFSLPDYENFATDFCFRLNRGILDYFYKKDKVAAVCFICGNNLLLNGIASFKKGYGKKAVDFFLKKYKNYNLFAVCENSVLGFYEKCNFIKTDILGFWE